MATFPLAMEAQLQLSAALLRKLLERWSDAAVPSSRARGRGGATAGAAAMPFNLYTAGTGLKALQFVKVSCVHVHTHMRVLHSMPRNSPTAKRRGLT